jgi:hypothetical protein
MGKELDEGLNLTPPEEGRPSGTTTVTDFVAFALLRPPAHRAISRDPLLTYHHHSHIHIE